MKLANQIVDLSRAMHARDEDRREFCELCPDLAAWSIGDFQTPGCGEIYRTVTKD